MNDFKYFLTILDDYSLFTWIILMCDKSIVRKHIIDLVTKTEMHYETVIKTIHTYNRPEFFYA